MENLLLLSALLVSAYRLENGRLFFHSAVRTAGSTPLQPCLQPSSFVEEFSLPSSLVHRYISYDAVPTIQLGVSPTTTVSQKELFTGRSHRTSHWGMSSIFCGALMWKSSYNRGDFESMLRVKRTNSQNNAQSRRLCGPVFIFLGSRERLSCC